MTYVQPCVQPLHVCGCDGCDLERRRRVRLVAERWFEEATWRLLRRKAQARIDAEVEADLFPSQGDQASSGVREIVRSRPHTTHRALRPVTRKLAT